MESLRWRLPERPERPRTERLRPVVRRRATPTRRAGGAPLRIVAGTAGVALAVGLAVSASLPGAPGAQRPTPVGLAALAPDVAGRPWLARRGDDRWVWGRAGARGRH